MMHWRSITHRTRTIVDRRNQPPEPQEALHEKIARLAYSYWEARGYQGGSAADDWFRAEKELRDAMSAGAALSTEANKSAHRNKEYSPQPS